MDDAAYWGMSGNPFSEGAESATAPLIDEALARLSFLVDSQRPLGILVGETGTGKSTLLKRFSEKLWRRGTIVCCESLLGRQAYEMLWRIGQQVGARPKGGEPVSAIWNAVEHRLAELALDRRRVVILLDDVDGMLGDVALQLGRLLTQTERFPRLLSLVLATTPAAAPRLGERIAQQAHLRIDLGAWTVEETAEFMHRAVTRAGRAKSPFERAAVERLHYLAEGMPGRIRRTAELALMVAAGEKRSSIDEALIEAVFSEFTSAAAAA